MVNKTFANMNYHLVFLCPAGEKNSINFKAVKISNGKKSYALYKDIPENVQRFERNQWIAMIDIQTSYFKRSHLRKTPSPNHRQVDYFLLFFENTILSSLL